MRLCLALVLCVMAPLASASAVYKCVDESGRTQFTDQPCSATDKAEVIYEPAGASGAAQAVGPAIGQTDAANQCEQAAKQRAHNPSTVDFSRFWSAGFDAQPDGRATYVSQFTAKNAFGLELKFDIACHFTGSRLANVAVSQAH